MGTKWDWAALPSLVSDVDVPVSDPPEMDPVVAGVSSGESGVAGGAEALWFKGIKVKLSELAPKDTIYIPSNPMGAGYLSDAVQHAKHAYLVGEAPSPIPKVYHQSNKDDWGTPWDFYLWVDNLFGLTLDVCATAQNAKCKDYLTPEMNSKEITWWGRVWMNPPYSEVGEWVDEMCSAAQCGEMEIGVALVAARPDTQWWWRAVEAATEVWFLKGRLTFEGAENSAPFPSALLIFYPPGSHANGTRRVQWVDWHTSPPTWITY